MRKEALAPQAKAFMASLLPIPVHPPQVIAADFRRVKAPGSNSVLHGSSRM